MIRDNFKKVGIVNLILIELVLIYDVIRLFKGDSAIGQATIIVHILGYFVGLLYAFSGYKKDAAKYYKLYMLAVLVAEVMSIFNLAPRTQPDVISYVLRGACIVFAILLTFAKDLGSKTTLSICSASLFIHIFNLVRIIINANNKLAAATNSVSDLALIIIALVFILAKYEDKKARGTN